MSRSKSIAIAITIFVLAGLMAACGGAGSRSGKGKTGHAAGRKGLGSMDEGARCEAKDGRESLVDLNQDDVPDVRKVYKTVGDNEVLVCREADLNFDGVKDWFVFFSDTGQITRDEADLDFDKGIELITTYAKGKAVKQEYDTNSDGLVDRVRYLQDGMPIRLEADRNGDGKVDEWEYYQDGKLVRVGTDDDWDGKADSWWRDNEPAAGGGGAAVGGGEEGEGDAEEEDAEADEDEEKVKKSVDKAKKSKGSDPQEGDK